MVRLVAARSIGADTVAARDERCVRALLAEILEQHRGTQRIADRHDAVPRQLLGQQRQELAQVLAAAGIVVAGAERP